MSDLESRVSAVEILAERTHRDLEDLRLLLSAATHLLQSVQLQAGVARRMRATDSTFAHLLAPLETPADGNGADSEPPSNDGRFDVIDRKLDELLRRVPPTS